MSPNSISVVVPTYDAAKFLPALLQALSIQDEQPDEYIFVDGESKDNTLELVRCFTPNVPVRVFSRPPQGVYDAWNQGIELAQGEWVWIVCADDLVAPDAIAVLRRCIAAGVPSDTGFVSWPIICVDESGSLIADQARDSPLCSIDPRLMAEKHIRSAGLEAALVYAYRGYFISFMSQAFRRVLWLEEPFDIGIGPSADIKWAIRAHLRGWRKLHQPGSIASWRIQSQSITSSFWPEARLRAHAELRLSCLPRLAVVLELSEKEHKIWENAGFVHDAYDWYAVLRSARSVGAMLDALRGVLTSAGPWGTVRLALGQLGLVSRPGHELAARQFRKRFGAPRLATAIEWRS